MSGSVLGRLPLERLHQVDVSQHLGSPGRLSAPRALLDIELEGSVACRPRLLVAGNLQRATRTRTLTTSSSSRSYTTRAGCRACCAPPALGFWCSPRPALPRAQPQRQCLGPQVLRSGSLFMPFRPPGSTLNPLPSLLP